MQGPIEKPQHLCGVAAIAGSLTDQDEARARHRPAGVSRPVGGQLLETSCGVPIGSLGSGTERTAAGLHKLTTLVAECNVAEMVSARIDVFDVTQREPGPLYIGGHALIAR